MYPQTSVSFLRVSFLHRLEGLVKRVRFNTDAFLGTWLSLERQHAGAHCPRLGALGSEERRG